MRKETYPQWPPNLLMPFQLPDQKGKNHSVVPDEYWAGQDLIGYKTSDPESIWRSQNTVVVKHLIVLFLSLSENIWERSQATFRPCTFRTKHGLLLLGQAYLNICLYEINIVSISATVITRVNYAESFDSQLQGNSNQGGRGSLFFSCPIFHIFPVCFNVLYDFIENRVIF